MFSFHKPRVYRSVSGCCICRAKSSSSRFTDSKRYEDVFFECFKLSEDRSGEICNACVLLVKRWKKLPVGSQRNWEHVVDARAGHGSKPLSKINNAKKNKLKVKATKAKRQEENIENNFEIPLEATERLKNKFRRNRVSSPSGFSDGLMEMECLSESGSGSYQSSPIPSPGPVDDDSTSNCINSSTTLKTNGVSAQRRPKRRGTGLPPQKNRSSMSSFLDFSFWKREKTCCGIIFKGPFGEVMLDRRFLNPCCRSNPSSLLPSPEFETGPTESGKGNGLDCFTIDSGYEDSASSAIEAFHMLNNNNNVNPKDANNKMMVGPFVSNQFKLNVD